MKILGIHFQSHDTSVALIHDGKIIYAAGNERFSRRKMDREPPISALLNCFSYTKTNPSDIDKVVLTGNPFPRSYFNRFKELSWKARVTKGKYFLLWKKIHLILLELFISTGVPHFIYRDWLSKFLIKKKLQTCRSKFLYVHHHMAHLYSAYYLSGFKTCLAICAEGSGFDETLSIYHVRNDKWSKITENHLPDSAGKFYELVTAILGFNIYKHAGKITGLAAYGDSKKVYKHIKDLLIVRNMKLRLNSKKFLNWWVNYWLTKKLPKEIARYNREDIAAAFQKRLEDCVVEIIKKAIKLTGEDRVALAGGVFGNVKLNQKIHELSEVEQIYIHQAMGDDGLALGAAARVSNLEGYKINRPNNVYFGPNYTEKDIFKSLKKYKIKFTRIKNIEKKVAKLLSENNVIARFNGRMEYGPRALGNRSILYEAKDKSVNDWLNTRLQRTEFMPFAPVTLEKYAKKCYKYLKGAEYASRFMVITFDCTEYMKKISPACVHVDGTARPQILHRKDNPHYHKILEEYNKITNIPTLVNTSFNMHEEPIVCTPDDAIRAFLSSGIDYLAIGPFLVAIKENLKIAEKLKKNLSSRKYKKSKNLVQRFLEH